ncbi:MAG: hypothetical protein LBU84_09415, partial [Prevotella sp.]|nr:hypothetical protein [Prevotella sp.]
MENNNNWKKTDETTSITDIIFEYLRYWKWFIVSILVFLTIGAIVILVTQKEYKSSLSILLNEDKGTGKASAAEFDLDALGLLSTTNNIENEVAILSSPDLMRSVVDTLNLQAVYYINKRFRKTELYNQSPFFVSIESIDKSGVSGIRFYIQKNGQEYHLNGTYKVHEINQDINQKLHTLPTTIKLNEVVEINIQATGKEIIENEKYYVSISNKTSTVSSLCNNLSISPTSKTSSVLNIGLIGYNTEKGATILRELVKQYNEMNVNIKNEIAYNTAIFINDRLKEISAELGDAEENVVDFKQKNQITDLNTEAQLFVQQTGQHEQKLMEVETQLNVISLI